MPGSAEPNKSTMDEPEPQSRSSPGWVPVPDPTTLTTQIVNQAKSDLRRESTALRELLEARVSALEGVTGALGISVDKIPDEMNFRRTQVTMEFDRRVDILRNSDESLRAEIVEQVVHLQNLHEERFTAIQQQFNERDVRGEQEKKASKKALDAALLAQKESVSQQNDANTTAATKSETSFTKQIDQIGTLIATLEKSLTDRITELKERIDRGEGAGAGTLAERTEIRAVQTQQRLTMGAVVGLISAGLVAIGIVASTLIAVLH